MENIDLLLDELQGAVEHAKKSVFSGSDIIINRSYLLELISRIRAGLPEVIAEANYIKQQLEEMLYDASEKATKLVADAEQRANDLLDQSEIIAKAEAEAKAIVEDASAYKEKMEFDAKIKIDKMLADSEQTITDTLMLIRNNREELRGMLKK